MSEKGGRTSTTWTTGSSWKTDGGKKMKTIRVPEALADHVMSYARVVDAGNAVSHGITEDRREVVLSAIAKYILLKSASYHPNQHSRTLDTNTRSWDELRKLQAMVQNEPEKLGLKMSSN